MNVGINRFKASSHPTKADGVYLGVVKRVLPDGKAYVYIPKLANTLGPMRVANMIQGGTIAEGNRVICGNVGGSSEEMYVLGHLTPVTPEYSARDIKISIFMDVD